MATASKELSPLARVRTQRRITLLKLKRELIYAGPDPGRQKLSMMLLMDILGYRCDPFHQEIIVHQNRTHYGDRSDDLTLGYRGGGKSTAGTICRSIKYVLENPNLRILFTSDTVAAAQALLREVRAHLQHNSLLIEMFGPFFDLNARTEIGRFREGAATIMQRTDLTVREPTFTSIGIGGQMASWHFDVAFPDDLVTLGKSRTPTQRKYLSDWYGSTLMGAFLPHTKVHHLGTRYYPNDQWQVLVEGRADEVDGPLAGSTLKIPLVTMDAEGNMIPNHPERYPLDVCKRIRKRMGAYHFNAQMQQDTRAGEGIIFNYADLMWWGGGESMPPVKKAVFQYHDLAAKKTDTGDFYAGITIAVGDLHGERCIWVLDLVHERAGMRKQREYILSLAERWHPDRAGVEAVAMQAGFAEEIQQMTLLPITPVPVEADKVFRARRVSYLVEDHKVFLPLPETAAGQRCQVLIDELTMFPEAEHDDCVDAFVGALTLAVFGGPKAASPTMDDHMLQDEDLLANYD